MVLALSRLHIQETSIRQIYLSFKMGKKIYHTLFQFYSHLQQFIDEIEGQLQNSELG